VRLDRGKSLRETAARLPVQVEGDLQEVAAEAALHDEGDHGPAVEHLH